VFVSHVFSLHVRSDALNDHTFDVKITSSCRMERSSMVVMYGDCMVGLVRNGEVERWNVVEMVGLVVAR
jgi:hypothetical protein